MVSGTLAERRPGIAPALRRDGPEEADAFAGAPGGAGGQDAAPSAPPRRWAVPALVTAIALVAAGLGCWAIWDHFVAAPWTRDGRVRAYTVAIAPEIPGRITELPVRDNQFVRKGDLLMVIEPVDYVLAVSMAQAQREQARADMDNRRSQAERRRQLTTLSTSVEEKQTFATNAASAEASFQAAVSSLAKARVNLERTRIVSPVNGWVTNLQARVGDYASTGTRAVSVVDADSFWIDGYFEETKLGRIRDGDPARMRLMGYERRDQILRGHVDSVSRGITVTNATPDQAGLANVNPIFTWVRLAQRIPVRIHIDEVPDGVRLVIGQTATVEVDGPEGTAARALPWQR